MPAYNALFQHDTGWTGSDAILSVALGQDKTLWLFGDTFYGPIENGKRCLCLTRNSIALQRGVDPATASVRFYYGPEHEGVPDPFFTPPDGQGWFWPRHGIRTGDGLYIFLTQLVDDSSSPEFIFGKRVASWLARVANPDDRPDQWRISYTKVPWSRLTDQGADVLSVGQSVVRDGLVYIYATEEVRSDQGLTRYLLTARVSEPHLADFDHWRFYDDGRWSTDQAEASRGIEVISPDFSVSYQPSVHAYLIVYPDWRPDQLANGHPKQILVRYAQTPVGSWTEPNVIYRCPEPVDNPDRYCYAAKGHPELSRASDELIVTYATSNAAVGAVNDTEVYFPRFVRVRFLSGGAGPDAGGEA